MHKRQPWKDSLHVNGQEVESRLDTGANITVVPMGLLSRFEKGTTLLKPDMVILGLAKQRLDILGVMQDTVTFNDIQ